MNAHSNSKPARNNVQLDLSTDATLALARLLNLLPESTIAEYLRSFDELAAILAVRESVSAAADVLIDEARAARRD